MSSVRMDRLRERRRLPAVPIYAGERGRSVGYWGMWGLIATEAALFAVLLTSYWFLRFREASVWPPEGIAKPDLPLVLVMSAILLGSSAPMHWAKVGIEKGRLWQLRLGLLVTFVMGAAFVGLQAFEYAHSLEEFTPQANVYGSLFYTITAFHGAHVLIGLLMVAWLQWYAWRGAFSRQRFLPVEVTTMYWHFVDVVWVFILITIYLSPHFWP